MNPNFVLNDPRYAGASILLARDNFGLDQAVNMRPGRFSNMVLRQ